MKSDSAIHNICIAAIKRSTIKPYDYKWTKFYTSNEEFFLNYVIKIDLSDEELIICSTVITDSQYSILTTRRLCTNENGIIKWADMATSLLKLYGDFKGYDKSEWTFGKLELPSGEEFRYYIETGKASMIMIQAVKSRIWMNS